MLPPASVRMTNALNRNQASALFTYLRDIALKANDDFVASFLRLLVCRLEGSAANSAWKMIMRSYQDTFDENNAHPVSSLTLEAINSSVSVTFFLIDATVRIRSITHEPMNFFVVISTVGVSLSGFIDELRTNFPEIEWTLRNPAHEECGELAD